MRVSCNRTPPNRATVSDRLMIDFLLEFWRFLHVRKRFWLLPICVILGLFAGLVVFTQGSAISPFIYVLF
jgi:hypothetical protein